MKSGEFSRKAFAFADEIDLSDKKQSENQEIE